MVLKYHFGGRVVLYGKLRRNSLLCIYVGMSLPKATRTPIFRRNFLPMQIEKSNRRQHFLAEAKKKTTNEWSNIHNFCLKQENLVKQKANGEYFCY